MIMRILKLLYLPFQVVSWMLLLVIMVQFEDHPSEYDDLTS